MHVIFADEVTDPAPDSYAKTFGVTDPAFGAYIWVDKLKADIPAGAFEQAVASTVAHELTHKLIDAAGDDKKEHFHDPTGGEFDPLIDPFCLLYTGPDNSQLNCMMWGNVVLMLIDLPHKDVH